VQRATLGLAILIILLPIGIAVFVLWLRPSDVLLGVVIGLLFSGLYPFRWTVRYDTVQPIRRKSNGKER
jgi:hypothetical protein